MNVIKPIVNLSRIISSYDAVIIGLRGVISDDRDVFAEAVIALKNLKGMGKRIILNTNSYQRVATLVNELEAQGIPKDLWDVVVTAGEIMHYKMKFDKNSYGISGNKYFLIESGKNEIFDGLDFERVDSLSKADFVFVSGIANHFSGIEKYIGLLEDAANLSIPLICVGNDVATFVNGELGIGAGYIAEQYAVLGGRFFTIGKPASDVLLYSVDDFENIAREKTLLIGDSVTTDIKGANLLGIDSVLLSRGINEELLGEGYIPDISRVKELANNFEAYPDFVMSNLRW